MNPDSEDLFTINMTRAMEDNAFASGITIFEMMEIAGKVVAEEISKFANKKTVKRIVMLVGFGNNGGDALVAAKHLIEEGFTCYIILVGSKTKFNSLASQKNYEILQKILPKDNWLRIESKKDIETAFSEFQDKAIFLDALFGIGIKGKLKQPYKAVVAYLNNILKEDIISLDIPSGYDPEIKN